MCHTVPVATSPLNCRWIRRGSRGAIEGIEYAVCGRIHDAERVVSEAECKYCPAWEPPLFARRGEPAADPLEPILG